MNKAEATPYQEKLLALRAALLAQIAAQRGGVVSRAESAAAHFERAVEDSRAQLAVEKDLELALGEREVAELTAIDAALARVEAGTYGECTDCGVDIAPARLQATPEAPRCIGCQEKYEQRHHSA